MEAAPGRFPTGRPKDERVDSVVVLGVDEESLAFALLVNVGRTGRGGRKPYVPRRRMMMGVVVVTSGGVMVPVIVFWFGSVDRVLRLR